MDENTIYDNYRELVQGIFYYQNQQNEIKITSTKLILGTLAIIGFLLWFCIDTSNKTLSAICASLPWLSLYVLTILLLHDLLYKEGLKLGFFREALSLEKQHSWLPKLHKCLITEARLHNVSITGQSEFYFGGAALLFLISGIAIFVLPLPLTLSIRTGLLAALIPLFLIYRNILNKFLIVPREIIDSQLLEQENSNPPPPIEPSLLARLHAQGKSYIEHFSAIKMRYKKLTILVLAASFLCFLLIGVYKAEYIPAEKLYFISFLTLISLFGINLLRHLDISVSHEQIRTLFLSTIEIEKRDSRIPKPYSEISKILYSDRFDPVIYDFLYYSSINLAIIVSGLLVLFLKTRSYHSSLSLTICFGLLSLFLLRECLSFLLMIKRRLKFNTAETAQVTT